MRKYDACAHLDKCSSSKSSVFKLHWAAGIADPQMLLLLLATAVAAAAAADAAVAVAFIHDPATRSVGWLVCVIIR